MRANVAVNTQTKVAQRAGVSQSTVNRLLATEQAATVDVLEDLARAFGVKHAEYMLLDASERELLTLWGNIGDELKQTVLGFIRVSTNPNALNTDFLIQKDVPAEQRIGSAMSASKPLTKKVIRDDRLTKDGISTEAKTRHKRRRA